jgi:hypothetical protein
MKHGNWIPLSKTLTKELPLDRPYSQVEAAFALQVDFDNERPVSIAGYARAMELGKEEGDQLFQRARHRHKLRNQHGNPAESEGTDREQMMDRSRDTTIDTNTDTHTETKNVRVFSDSFMKEHWERWTRLKKGGPYRSPEIESIALEELHALSLGDEAIAANGLRAAIAAQAQSFSWCFKSLDNRQPQSHERSVHHTGRPSESDERFGADNIRWLELHARPSGP